jgi:hypothetical protein
MCHRVDAVLQDGEFARLVGISTVKENPAPGMAAILRQERPTVQSGLET